MEKSKVVIVGASHGGHQSILELLSRYGQNVDITLFEAGDFISFVMWDGVIFGRSSYRCQRCT